MGWGVVGVAAVVFCPLSANTKETERHRWWKAAPQAPSAPPSDWLSVRYDASSFINVIFPGRSEEDPISESPRQSSPRPRRDALPGLSFHSRWNEHAPFPECGDAQTPCLVHMDEICLPRPQFCLFRRWGGGLECVYCSRREAVSPCLLPQRAFVRRKCFCAGFCARLALVIWHDSKYFFSANRGFIYPYWDCDFVLFNQ